MYSIFAFLLKIWFFCMIIGLQGVFAETAQRIPWPVSSEYSELSPTVNIEGTILIFASNRPGGRGSFDLYESRWLDGKWQTPQALENINTQFFEGYPSLSPDGNTLYFSSNRHRQDPRSKDLDIYVAHRNNQGVFMPAQPMSLLNSPYFDAGVTLSADGKELYFASNRPGGKGKADIYLSLLENGKRQSPKLAPGNINTDADELNPQLLAAGDRLFYSSDRRGGAGGYDIYVSARERVTAAWQPGVNLGSPWNNQQNQLYFFLSENSEQLFLSQGNIDEENIFLFNASRLGLLPILTLKGRIIEETDKRKFIQTPVIVKNLTPAIHKISSFRFPEVTEYRSDDEGYFQLYIPWGDKYILMVDVPGYTPYRQVYDLTGKPEQLLREITIKMTVLKAVKSEPAMFRENDATITEELLTQLDQLAADLKQSQSVIYLFGYVDFRESRNKQNRGLGFRRAEAVRNHLISRGLPPDQVRISGQGIAGSAQSVFNEKKLARGRIVTIRTVETTRR